MHAFAVAACIHDLLKWPSKDLDITHAIHQGESCVLQIPDTNPFFEHALTRNAALLGFFALKKLCSDESRPISQLSRSEIAFALRNIVTISRRT